MSLEASGSSHTSQNTNTKPKLNFQLKMMEGVPHRYITRSSESNKKESSLTPNNLYSSTQDTTFAYAEDITQIHDHTTNHINSQESTYTRNQETTNIYHQNTSSTQCQEKYIHMQDTDDSCEQGTVHNLETMQQSGKSQANLHTPQYDGPSKENKDLSKETTFFSSLETSQYETSDTFIPTKHTESQVIFPEITYTHNHSTVKNNHETTEMESPLTSQASPNEDNNTIATHLQHPHTKRIKQTQLLIDIDDTVLSSGGIKVFNMSIGGVDQQYARGSIYPGVIQFLLELSTHELPSKIDPLSLAVLTARLPQVPIKSDSKLNISLKNTANRHGFTNWGIDCENKVMYSTINEWLFQETKAQKKIENFLLLDKYMDNLNYNVNYIWIGDIGEMDKQVGEAMANIMPHKIKAVFMHYVADRTVKNRILPDNYEVNGVPFIHYKTYIKAAEMAYRYGLLSQIEVIRVAVQAIRDLDDMSFPIISQNWLEILIDFKQIDILFNLGSSKVPVIINSYNIYKKNAAEITQFKKQLRESKAK